jgi:hypothetical protein
MNKTIELVFQETKNITHNQFNEYIAILTITSIVVIAFWLSFKKENKIETKC